MRYDAPKGTEVSTTLPGGEAVSVTKWPADVVDEALADVLEALVADKRNPLKHARKTKEE